MSSCFLPGRSRTNQDDRYAPGPISSTDDGALIAGRAIGGKDSRTVSGVVVFGIHLAQRRAGPVIRPVVSPRRSQPVKAPEQRDPARRSFDPLWPSVAERCFLAVWGAARIGGHRLATTTPPNQRRVTRHPAAPVTNRALALPCVDIVMRCLSTAFAVPGSARGTSGSR